VLLCVPSSPVENLQSILDFLSGSPLYLDWKAIREVLTNIHYFGDFSKVGVAYTKQERGVWLEFV